MDDKTKKEIIEATNRIAPKIKIEPDESRRIEMKIWWKEYKILDVNTGIHTDDEYRASDSYNWIERDEVMLWWMIWDDVNNWENKKLKEYVKEKQSEKFHIPEIEEMRSLLNKLWEEAGITEMEDQVAMLMYITGMYGRYWLSMWDEEKSDSQVDSRPVMACEDDAKFFSFYWVGDENVGAASLCMIDYQ